MIVVTVAITELRGPGRPRGTTTSVTSSPDYEGDRVTSCSKEYVVQ
jgi:hypothetical protein